MKVLLIILSLLLAIILQTSLVPFLTVSEVGPNLILILIIILVVFNGFKKIWPYIILIGFFLDLLAGLPFGLMSLSLVSTAYLVDWFNRSIFSGIKFWITASLVVLGTLIYNLFLLGLGKIFVVIGLSQTILWYASGSFFVPFFRIIGEIGYNLLISFIVYAGAKKIFRQI
jgi:rod shape-determining protein MreD